MTAEELIEKLEMVQKVKSETNILVPDMSSHDDGSYNVAIAKGYEDYGKIIIFWLLASMTYLFR